VKSLTVGQKSFTNRLTSAGTNTSTYDRYTFYRLMSPLGTDSSAQDGRLNLNYENTDGRGHVLRGAETNQLSRTPRCVCTNAAHRLLHYHTAKWRTEDYIEYTSTFGFDQTNEFGLTNMPVYVRGRFVYSPAVNRLLQLAANLYDASTRNAAGLATANGSGRD